MTTYSINPVDAFLTNSSTAASMDATFRYYTAAVWFKYRVNSVFKHLAANRVLVGEGLDQQIPTTGVGIVIDGAVGDRTVSVTVGNGTMYSANTLDAFGYGLWDVNHLIDGEYYLLMVSIDSVGQIMQAYINNTRLAEIDAPLWFDNTEISAPVATADFPTPSISVGQLTLGIFTTPECIADAAWLFPGTFFSLDFAPNRRMFIDVNDNPLDFSASAGFVDAGIYLHRGVGGTVADMKANSGSFGGTFTDLGSNVTCAGWFGPTALPFSLPDTGTPTPPAYDVLQVVTTVDGAKPYWIERLTRVFTIGDTLENAEFLDGAIQATAALDHSGSTGVKLYGLWHLRGKTGITAWVGGLDCGDYTIAADGTLFVPYGTDPDGLFTKAFFDATDRVARVGYNYTSKGQILRPGTAVEAGSANGPPLGKVRRGHQLGVLLVNSVGVSFGTDFAKLRVASFKTKNGTPYNSATMFSGVHQTTLEDDYSFDSQLAWQVSRPYPVTITAIGNFLATQDR